MSTQEDIRRGLRHATPWYVVPFDLNNERTVIFDFSENNEELREIDFTDTTAFGRYVDQRLQRNNTTVGLGGYNENRVLYCRSALFSGQEGQEPRTVHLGIDIWAPAGTPVFAPLPGKIHSFRDNNQFGDYGPTIILEHEIDGVTFYTLYGHLRRSSLARLRKGMSIAQGAAIAELGSEEENGSWPPHVHFQIITDMQGREGDFPGVATMSQREEFLELCPDPNLILQVGRLENMRVAMIE